LSSHRKLLPTGVPRSYRCHVQLLLSLSEADVVASIEEALASDEHQAHDRLGRAHPLSPRGRCPRDRVRVRQFRAYIGRRRRPVSHRVSASRDRRVEVVHERDHVDHRLGRQTRDGGGPEVVQLHPVREQRRKPLTLGPIGSRPRGSYSTISTLVLRPPARARSSAAALRLSDGAISPRSLSDHRGRTSVAQLGEHLANISTGNARNDRVGMGTHQARFSRRLLPFRAHRYPAVPALFSLDKAEVIGSSPISPTSQKPC
jgi:hypothetical protein